MSSVSISVAIPTLGRSTLLGEIVEYLRGTGGIHEVLVTFNGGDAAGGLERLVDGSVRILTLRQASLQAARNLALNEATGEYVAFLDDDAMPGPGWYEALVGFVARHPDVAAVGGPARLPPGWPVPSWVTEAALGYLGIVDLGDREIRCPPWRYPYGCNFAVRRERVRDVGGFNPAVGYAGRSVIPNGETTLLRTLQKHGGDVWYTPSMAVSHYVARDRFRLAYLVRRAYSQGRGDMRMARLHPELPVSRGPGAVARACRWSAAALFRWLAGQPREACDHVLRAARQIGMVRG
ncbi:MAG: glycosyltransferase [Acidobacteria bacterium]|nr:glycosyltransferase [Acidobacteriota bacterium]